MKKLLFIFFLPIWAFSQGAQLVLNNNAYINITNSAYLVIDNSNANAITTTGTGGNIITEEITNRIKWNIGNQTGNYQVPFTNNHLVKIPYTMNLTSAGNAGGYFLLSTIPTDAQNKHGGVYPSPVNNMCSSVTNANESLYAIDRFWIIDNDNYTTKPAATLSFGYDWTNEGAGPNTIGELNLQAQRFNPGYGYGNYCEGLSSIGSWQDLLFGTANTGAKRVENVTISSADFFKVWVLQDKTRPLPIELTSFSASCNDGVELTWKTETETNVSHFELYSSRDGYEWNFVSSLNASGNSILPLTYSYNDMNGGGLTYYRLESIDYNGGREVYGPISTDCNNQEPTWSIYPIPVINNATVSIHALEDGAGQLVVIDDNGRKVIEKDVNLITGTNQYQIDTQHLTPSVYTVFLLGNKMYKPLKFVKF